MPFCSSLVGTQNIICFVAIEQVLGKIEVIVVIKIKENK